MTLATCNEFGLCTNHYTLKFVGRIPTGFAMGTQIPVGGGLQFRWVWLTSPLHPCTPTC
jgi:hypothetical protein